MIKKLLLILINTLLIFFINNLSTVKAIIFHYQNIQINFLNLNIILSLIILIILFILKKRKSISNKIFIYCMAILYSYNILANLFYNKNILGFLLIYIFLIFCTYITYILTNKKFEIAITLFTSVLLIGIYLLGILDLLKLSYILIALFLIVGIFVLAKKRKKYNIKKIFEEEFFDNSLIIFSILYIIAIIGGAGRYVHVWDEYSHWAFDAKVTIENFKITLYTGMNYSTSSLPPILTLWHFFVSLFSKFSESNLYIGLSIFIYIYMMPMYVYIKNKKASIIFLYALTVFGINLLFDGAYSYTVLYADLAMGFVGTACITTYFYFKRENIKNNYILPIFLVILTMMKSSGFILSGIILLFIYLTDYLDVKNKKINIIKFLKQHKNSILGILIILISWYACVKITGPVKDYNFSLMPDVLKPNLGLKLNKEFLLKIFTSMVNSFDDGILFGIIKINLFPFIVGLMLIIFILNEKIDKKNYKKTNAIFIISYIIFFLLTFVSVFVMFSVYEAGELKSFGRYLNCFHLILINYCLLLASLLCKETEKNDKLFKIILIAIIIFIPFRKLSFFITDFSDRYETEKISNSRRNDYIGVIENTSSDAKVYIINQQDMDSIMPIWYARYYCYPRKISASNGAINWKILTESNEWDLQDWGLNIDSFQKHLIDYNFEYLYLYSSTEEFFEVTEQLYNDNIKDVKHNKLFKINKINENEITLDIVENSKL